MKNKVFRKVFGVFAVIIVIVLIYLFLPGQYKMPLKETFQSITMSWSEDVVKTLKNATVPNNSLTFGAMMSRYDGSAWTIGEKIVDDIGNGSMTVYADCYKVTVAMEHEFNDDNNMNFTRAHVRLTFDVTRENGEITKATLRTVKIAESEYDRDSFYYQAALDALCK